MSELVIKATTRDKTGKGSAKKYRTQGLIPGEFYSSHEDNLHILVDKKDFETFLSHLHGLLTLDIKDQDKKLECVIKDLQNDPVRGNVLHVDFLGVKQGEKLTIKVPVVLNGIAPGVKIGGILEHIIREVEVECLPRDIPEKLEIDISSLEIGDSIRVKDLSFENIVIQDDPEETILLIEHSKVAVETEGLEETGAEESLAEPEVITAKKDEE